MRGICEGVEQHLWSSDSRPAHRGICAFPVPRCTAVRAVGCGLLTEESEVKARWAGYFERLAVPGSFTSCRVECQGCYYPYC